MGIKKLSAICISLAGCASYPQPTDNLATSVGAVRGAQEAGAEQIPDAALHVRLAEEQNEKARQLMTDGENERAAYMADRAKADADLALAMAHEERARKQARQASAAIPAPAEANPANPNQPQPMAPAAQPMAPAVPPTATP